MQGLTMSALMFCSMNFANFHFKDDCGLQRSFKEISFLWPYISSTLLVQHCCWSGNSSSVTLILKPPSPRLCTWPECVLWDQQSIKCPSYFLLLFYPENREELSLAFCTATPLIGTRICKNGNLSKTCHKILKANHKLTNFFHSFKGNSNWNLHVNFYEDPWGHP